jgi:hypothetical protein
MQRRVKKFRKFHSMFYDILNMICRNSIDLVSTFCYNHILNLIN